MPESSYYDFYFYACFIEAVSHASNEPTDIVKVTRMIYIRRNWADYSLSLTTLPVSMTRKKGVKRRRHTKRYDHVETGFNNFLSTLLTRRSASKPMKC